MLYDSTYMRFLEQSISKDKKQKEGCQELGRGNEELFNGDRVSVEEDEKILDIDSSDDYTTMSVLMLQICIPEMFKMANIMYILHN